MSKNSKLGKKKAKVKVNSSKSGRQGRYVNINKPASESTEDKTTKKKTTRKRRSKKPAKVRPFTEIVSKSKGPLSKSCDLVGHKDQPERTRKLHDKLVRDFKRDSTLVSGIGKTIACKDLARLHIHLHVLHELEALNKISSDESKSFMSVSREIRAVRAELKLTDKVKEEKDDF